MLLGRGRRVVSLAGFGAVVDKLPFKTTMSFGLSCGMMGGLFYAGMSTPLDPLFLGRFSPAMRRFFAVLSRCPASWRRDGENGRKMAENGRNLGEKRPRNSGG